MLFYILHRYIENPSINSLVTERCGWINLDLCTLGWSGSQASHKSSTSEGLPENFWFYLDSPRAALFGPIQLQVADIRKKQGKNRNIRSNACKIVFWTKVHITVSLARTWEHGQTLLDMFSACLTFKSKWAGETDWVEVTPWWSRLCEEEPASRARPLCSGSFA